MRDPTLFLRFAQTPLTLDGILGFANRYGSLTRETNTESLSFWRSEIADFSFCLQLWFWIEEGNEAELEARFTSDAEAIRLISPPGYADAGTSLPMVLRDKTPDLFERLKSADVFLVAMVFICSKVNGSVVTGVQAALEVDLEACEARYESHPKDLLTTIWLQLALAIAGKKQYRRCAVCSEQFEVRPGVNRSSRLTCSTACRNRGYRLRQEKARKLHEKGVTVKEIARQLGTTMSSVKRWVATGSKP